MEPQDKQMNSSLELKTQILCIQNVKIQPTEYYNQDVTEFSNATSQLDIVDTYRPHHPTTAKYKFFLNTCETLIKLFSGP